jgi:hypothetical protein
MSGRRRTSQRAWKKAFLEALSGGATITHAARLAGVARSAVYALRDEDESFAVAWDEAYAEGSDTIEQEAIRRAVQGIEGRPVTYRGQVVAEMTEYSDTLLLALLKARKPESYRERMDVKHSGQIATPTAAELAANRAAGLDDALEAALANVASIDAARARRAAG